MQYTTYILTQLGCQLSKVATGTRGFNIFHQAPSLQKFAASCFVFFFVWAFFRIVPKFYSEHDRMDRTQYILSAAGL